MENTRRGFKGKTYGGDRKDKVTVLIFLFLGHFSPLASLQQ